ncbi:LysR family transcriptional regulator [Aquimarina sediminis]|uniref:LysR family transcriptional regulator n=1 Tax=Aquimarina sediminis TaxID=2070536 RepID=UPI000CA0880A|nr:LysR family transcriptional regulator [Aquimarina sediminis]
MNLQFIKYFLVLSSTENFTKGAKQVNVVQSTFSAGIKKLEEHFGVQLFERNNRNVKLTKYGQQFLPKAKELLNKWSDIEQDFNVINLESLRIGFVQNLSINDILHYVNDYQKLNSLSKIVITEDKHEKLYELLQQGEIHAFFSDKNSISTDFEKIPVAVEKLYFAINADHPLAKKEFVNLQQIAEEDFIERSQCVLHDEVFGELSKRNIKFTKTFTAHNNETVLALVASNMGFTLMPKPNFSVPEVKFIPIKDADFSRRISLFWKNDYRKKELHKFLSLLRETTHIINGVRD